MTVFLTAYSHERITHQTLSGHPFVGWRPGAISAFFPPECPVDLCEKRAAAAGEFVIGAAYLASAESDDARTCGLA